jgi:hypothetical protein
MDTYGVNNIKLRRVEKTFDSAAKMSAFYEQNKKKAQRKKKRD